MKDKIEKLIEKYELRFNEYEERVERYSCSQMYYQELANLSIASGQKVECASILRDLKSLIE